MSSGKGTQAEIGSVFLNTLFESTGNQQTKKEILMRHWHEITSEELDKLIVTLEQAGLITITQSGPHVSFKMTESCLEVFRKEVE